MSRKFNFIPHISDYTWVREQMAADLAYRMHDRQAKTSLGQTVPVQSRDDPSVPDVHGAGCLVHHH